jgi:hypothetical protein
MLGGVNLLTKGDPTDHRVRVCCLAPRPYDQEPMPEKPGAKDTSKCRWSVGQVAELPSRGLRCRSPPGRSSPPSRPPSQGSSASRSSTPHDVAARLVRRPLLAVVFGHEVFRRPVCSWTRRSGSGSRRLESLAGHSSAFRVPASRPRPSPPGILFPFDDVGVRVRHSRELPSRHNPSARFLTSSTVSLPATPCGHEGRCRPWGSVADPRPLRASGRSTSPHCSRSIAAGFPLPSL